MNDIKEFKSLLEYFDSDKSYEYEGKELTGVIYEIGDIRVCRMMNPITNEYVDLPVQIFGIYKNEDTLTPPLYDVRMVITWSNKQDSGYIEIKNFALWRYELERDPSDEEKELFNES